MNKRSCAIFTFGLGALLLSPMTMADGKAVYEKSCMMCHGPGMAGAPKVGDVPAWKERLAKGIGELEHNAINGVQGYSGMMPPKGGNPSLSDDDVKAAVAYMIAESK